MAGGFREQLATVDDMSSVTKGVVLLASVPLLYAIWFAWIAFACLVFPDVALYDHRVVRFSLPITATFLVALFTLIATGQRLRRQHRDPGWYMPVAAGLYGLAMNWGGYLVGNLSLATGVVLMGAPLVGFLLTNRHTVFWGYGLAYVTVMGTSLASALGWIPYAPMVIAPHDRSSALLWTTSYYVYVVPLMLCLVVATGIVLRHWQERESAIRALSVSDPLTRVYNRRQILRLLERELARSARLNSVVSVIMVDLDHFKVTNDTWGHAVGDRVLIATAMTLKGTSRQVDAVGRMGGEEFLLVLPETGLDSARLVAERLREQLSSLTLMADNGDEVAIRGSFGVVANDPARPVSAHDLVRAADRALYLAKSNGRNCVAWGPPPETEGPSRLEPEATPKPPMSMLARAFEWSPAAKTGLTMGVLLFVHLAVLGWLEIILTLPDRARLINVASGLELRNWLRLFIAIASGTLMAALLLRRSQSSLKVFQHTAKQFYVISLVITGYYVGIDYMPTGILLLFSPLFDFVIFDHALVYAGFASGVLAVTVVAYACALGWLPYAPLISVHGPAWQLDSLFWTLSLCAFYSVTMVIMMCLMDATLGRWREREAELRQLSLTDPLTGVHNRRSILELLERELASARRYERPLAVMLVDLDHFKKINDAWGHPTGDRVLQAAARALTGTMRDVDAIGRFGGEEFLVILPFTHPEGATILAERCRERLSELRVYADDGTPVPVSGSFGLVCHAVSGDDNSTRLLSQADQALYRAKAKGRNRVELDPD